MSGRTPSSEQLHALGSVLGNDRLSRLLAGDLQIGAPDGRHERDADRGVPAPRPGPTARLHSGPESARAADALGARAFTLGADVHFGAGELRPGTDDGRQLLDHELAHVDQQAHGGAPELQRQAKPDGGTDTDAAAGDEDEHADAGPLFPGAKNPAELSNEALLAEVSDTKTWLGRHHIIELEFGKREQYLAQLQEARNARIRGGQVWMADDALASGGQLLALSPTANGSLAVVAANGSQLSSGGAPGSVVFSRRQLDRTLAALGVPTLTEAAAANAGFLSSSVANGPTTSAYAPLIDTYARYTNTNTISSGFPGAMAEDMYALRAPGADTRVDLNTQSWREGPGGASRSGNFPIWDFREGTGELVQIKTSAAPTQKGRFDYYDTGLRDVSRTASDPARRALFDTGVWNLDPALAPSTGPLTPLQQAQWEQARSEAIRRSRVAVNSDDVAAYRTNLADRIAAKPRVYSALIEAYLAQQPVTASGTTFTTLAQIDAAPASVRAQARQLIAQRVVNQIVVENQVRTPGIQSLQGARRADVLDPAGQGTLPRPDLQRRTWPIDLALKENPGRYGPPMRSAAFEGLKYGGVSSILAGSALNLLYTGHLPSTRELGVLGVSGTAGSALAGPADVAVQAWLGRTAIAAIPRLRGGLGGFGVGGPLSALTTMGVMGFYDMTDPRTHFTGMDYAAKGGRAFVVGGLSAALTGAIMGAPGGPGGMVLGFLIGVTLYAATDYLIGDAVEGDIRSVGGAGSSREPGLGTIGR